MRCAIWYHLYNLKTQKTPMDHERVLLLAKLKSNTPPWMFFTFFKLYKWYQIAQNITSASFDEIVQTHHLLSGAK